MECEQRGLVEQLLAREVLRKQRKVAEFPPYLLDCRLVSVPSVKIDQARGGSGAALCNVQLCIYACVHDSSMNVYICASMHVHNYALLMECEQRGLLVACAFALHVHLRL